MFYSTQNPGSTLSAPVYLCEDEKIGLDGLVWEENPDFLFFCVFQKIMMARFINAYLGGSFTKMSKYCV